MDEKTQACLAAARPAVDVLLHAAMHLYLLKEHTEVRKIITGVSIITGIDASVLVKVVKGGAAKMLKAEQSGFEAEVLATLNELFAEPGTEQ